MYMCKNHLKWPMDINIFQYFIQNHSSVGEDLLDDTFILKIHPAV